MRTRLPDPLLLTVILQLGFVWLTSTLASSDFEIPSGSNGLAVDLSGRNLGESARLDVVMTTPTPLPSEKAGNIALRLLNVSGNPRLRRILVNGSLQVLQIDTLDLSGTSVTPTRELIEFTPPQEVLLSIRQVFINLTATPETPLDFPAFTELLHRLHVQGFVVNNWPVTKFASNFSRADNDCQSKNFNSVSVRSAGIRQLADAIVSATQLVDFSFNNISKAVGVSFSSASVNLGRNQLSQLASVSFRPGALCRTEVTRMPVVRLNDNALTMAALVEAVVSSPSQPMLLRGLDLSRNPLLAVSDKLESSLVKPEQRIRVADWLRLQAVVGNAAGQQDVVIGRLGSLLSRLFEPPGAGGPTRLDLSGNQLYSLAAVSRVLLAWTGGGHATTKRRLSELRLADWTVRTDHLNLSEFQSTVRPTRWLDLGNLDGSGVRSLSVVANQSLEESFDGMQAAWDVEVRVRPLPSACCRAQGADSRQLFCFIRPDAHAEYRRLICADSGGPATPPTPQKPPPAPALVLTLAAVAACLAILLVVVAVVGCIRRRRKRQSTPLRSQPRSSPRREIGVEATALRQVEEA